jgi:putative ABC transport system permease protein
MSIVESIKVSLGALASNKLRSILTMLGVIIGVAAVIALVSLGQGTQRSIETQMTRLGTNLITVSTQGFARFEPKDMDDLMSRVPTLLSVTPSIRSAVSAKARNDKYDTQITGAAAAYPDIRAYEMSKGRWFDEQEVSARRKVAVLGYTVYKQLFAERDGLGETVNLKGQTFTVIGVAQPKGSGMGQDPDDTIFIPYSTAMRLIGTRWLNSLVFKAQSSEVATAAANHLTRILEEKFRNTNRMLEKRFGRKIDPFRVFSQDELLDTVNQMTGTFTVLLAGIAGVSLLVGGIGIMNIMLVSVTERTREIGIRKAIGAKGMDILTQFLVEAVAISATGGIIGIVLGSEGAVLMGRLNKMSVSVSMTSVIVAFTFAAMVGIVFGVYPAYKASKLDPIVALRYE